MSSNVIITIIDGALILVSFILLIRFLSIRGKNTGDSEGISGAKMPSKNKLVFYSCFFIVLGIVWATLKFTGTAAEGMSGISLPSIGTKLPKSMRLTANDIAILLQSNDDTRYNLVEQIGYSTADPETEEEKAYRCFNISKKSENYGKLYFHKNSRNFILRLNYEGDYKYYLEKLSRFTANEIGSGRKQYIVNQACFISDLGMNTDGKGYLLLIKNSQ